jgi:hypothetical protein
MITYRQCLMAARHATERADKVWFLAEAMIARYEYLHGPQWAMSLTFHDALGHPFDESLYSADFD